MAHYRARGRPFFQDTREQAGEAAVRRWAELTETRGRRLLRRQGDSQRRREHAGIWFLKRGPRRCSPYCGFRSVISVGSARSRRTSSLSPGSSEERVCGDHAIVIASLAMTAGTALVGSLGGAGDRRLVAEG